VSRCLEKDINEGLTQSNRSEGFWLVQASNRQGAFCILLIEKRSARPEVSCIHEFYLRAHIDFAHAPALGPVQVITARKLQFVNKGFPLLGVKVRGLAALSLYAEFNQ
jgi:hypothetical protein